MSESNKMRPTTRLKHRRVDNNTAASLYERISLFIEIQGLSESHQIFHLFILYINQPLHKLKSLIACLYTEIKTSPIVLFLLICRPFSGPPFCLVPALSSLPYRILFCLGYQLILHTMHSHTKVIISCSNAIDVAKIMLASNKPE